MKKYRAVLRDYPEGFPVTAVEGVSVPDLANAKSQWKDSLEEARMAGKSLNYACGNDFYVHIESRDSTNAQTFQEFIPPTSEITPPNRPTV